MRRTLVILLAFLISAAMLVPAQALEPKAKIVAAAREVIVPRYGSLAHATAKQSETWRAFCTAPSRGTFETVRSAYMDSADAWAAIEFVRYGPILTDNRIERMAHWPERGNAVSRALGQLLSRSGTEDLAPERLMLASVAGQGLSALERLLFGDSADEALAKFRSGPDAARQCAVGQAIAAGLERNAADVRAEWLRPVDGVLATLETGDDAVIREAAARLATELLSFIEFVADRKVAAPLGDDPGSARPTLGESWRSGRSLDAIRTNLEGVEALARALVDPESDGARSALLSLENARSLAAGIDGDLSDLVEDRRQRTRLILLRDVLRGARELTATALMDSLGVTIGFNSRDGD
jgi:predicted lipoprotein